MPRARNPARRARCGRSLTGAEVGRTRARNTKAVGKKVTFRSGAPGAPNLVCLGSDGEMSHPPFEIARGLRRPIEYYPMFENALRAARGESIAAHKRAHLPAGGRASAPWLKRQSACLDPKGPQRARDPHAVGTENRMVSFPYPKLMNSNSRVDQRQGAAAHVLVTATARAAGVPKEPHSVFPWVGDRRARSLCTSRTAPTCARSRAIRIAGLRALELADTGRPLRSPTSMCTRASRWPCRSRRAELGLSLASGPLTVTGGLTFGGGPLNSYVLQSESRAWSRSCAATQAATRLHHGQRRLPHQARLRRVQHRAAAPTAVLATKTCKPRSIAPPRREVVLRARRRSHGRGLHGDVRRSRPPRCRPPRLPSSRRPPHLGQRRRPRAARSDDAGEVLRPLRPPDPRRCLA